MRKLAIFKKIGIVSVVVLLSMIMIIAAVAPVAANDAATSDKRDMDISSVSLYLDGAITLRFYVADLGSLNEPEFDF